MERELVTQDRLKNPAQYKELHSLIDQLLEKYGVSFNVFIQFASTAGVKLTHNRLRDLKYGRALLHERDLVTLRAAVGEPAQDTNYTKAIRMYRASVDVMCRSCASSDTNPRCWDASCPLRPVSPLSLAEENEVEDDGDDDLL